MLYTSLTRPVESEYLDSITSLKFTADGQTLMQPDGRWDIAILKRGDQVEVLRTGMTTRTVVYDHAAGDETLVISFKPSVFMSGDAFEFSEARGESHGIARSSRGIRGGLLRRDAYPSVSRPPKSACTASAERFMPEPLSP